MTKEQAVKFDHTSALNAAILLEICPKCEPYRDWYTYRRWKAQGEQVARGQHGTKLGIFYQPEKKVKGQIVKSDPRPGTATVFCRHQIT